MGTDPSYKIQGVLTSVKCCLPRGAQVGGSERGRTLLLASDTRGCPASVVGSVERWGQGVSVAGWVEACRKGSAWLHPGLPSLCSDTMHRATVVTRVVLGSSKAVKTKQYAIPERKGQCTYC